MTCQDLLSLKNKKDDFKEDFKMSPTKVVIGALSVKYFDK